MAIKVLIIAQNPKTEINLTNPLKNTKSLNTLMDWIKSSGWTPEEYELTFTNASDKLKFKEDVKNDSTILLMKLLSIIDRYDYIICLGKYSEKVINYSIKNYKHLFPIIGPKKLIVTLPHPSGLNRKLNNKTEIDNIINKLKLMR